MVPATSDKVFLQDKITAASSSNEVKNEAKGADVSFSSSKSNNGQ